MSFKIILTLGFFSLSGAGIWYLLYLNVKKDIIRRAVRKGKRPKLFFDRILFLSTGILLQIAYWLLVIGLFNWSGPA